MRSSTGRWVCGDDFFDRDADLKILENYVNDRNHVLLTGQRRMGKTSVVMELGRRLETLDWVFLFADVEGATCAEDAIAEIARAVHPVRSISSRFASGMKRWLNVNVQEISAYDFSVKIRAGLDAGSWRHHGEQLFQACAIHDKPVLLVIDELPIFLKRMLQHDGDAQRVDEFLSWLRKVLQSLGDNSPSLVISGSIGLEPLVRRLGMSDRINHLHPYHLAPWDRDTSIKCFNLLAENYQLDIEDGVANAVYEAMGVGIPHHVQSFFARLRDFGIMQGRDRVRVEDVSEVYRTELLGPPGQNDLDHYQTRLKEALEDESFSIAMEILAEAATQEVFTEDAQHCLAQLYTTVVDDIAGRISDTLEVLVHDGYLKLADDGYRFPSRLLKDWWAARFRGHYTPLGSRQSDD
ncbi:MAG: AAA family ATPase [Gammaproteobacteria bacterium]|nr:AAA family ATPase [Gammaproteobacteria bacterium]MDE0284437.1 AAA family ATPase [Gammaproteobacteria bacterium]MDE0511297.1 AAA family ATPase [Gammaproteobacteria bacterium]